MDKENAVRGVIKDTSLNVGHRSSKLRISLVNINIQYVTDSVNYNAQSFIGEVGGTLGLMLGLSFMSAIDFLEFFVSKFSCHQAKA